MLWFGLKNRIEDLERKAKLTDKSIQELFCPHSEFFPKYPLLFGYKDVWVKKCSECGKILKTFEPEVEKLEDEKLEMEKVMNKIGEKIAKVKVDNENKYF